MEEVKRKGAKGLKHITDENGNPVVARDFCFMVLEEEKKIIQDAINAERDKKGWMRIRTNGKPSQRKSRTSPDRGKQGRKSWGFLKYVIRVTIDERKIACDAVNAVRIQKGITLMKLHPGSLTRMYARKPDIGLEQEA